MSAIILQSKGYEPFFDFLKGVCIIWVIWEHTIPCLNETLFPFWGKQAVALFLLMQVFHIARKDGQYSFFKKDTLRGVFQRVILPFAIATLIAICIKSLNGDYEIIWWKFLIICGGDGPGSYYPYIFVQIAFITPLYLKLQKSKGFCFSAIATLLLSALCEMLCCIIHLPEFMYRLLCFRYLFLIPLGYYWYKNGINIHRGGVILLTIISVCAIYLFNYSDIDFSPIFYESNRSGYPWHTCHWICYFYVAFLLAAMLYRLMQVLPSSCVRVVCQLGKASWEIFCCQMCLLAISMSHYDTSSYLYITAIWALSLTIGFSLYRVRTAFSKS